MGCAGLQRHLRLPSNLMLVLDRSGAWPGTSPTISASVRRRIDNDGDEWSTRPAAAGAYQFLRAAARSILALASDATVRAGIVSFNDIATIDAPLQTISTTCRFEPRSTPRPSG